MASAAQSRPSTIGFVLGKPIERSPILPEVADLLSRAGHQVLSFAPRGVDDLRSAELNRCDLLIVRGLSAEILQVLQLWSERCINDPAASLAVTDRWGVITDLIAAGLPVPPTRRVARWGQVRAAGDDCVVKAADAGRGRSAGVLVSGQPRPVEPPFSGPWLVQRSLDAQSWEAKCYVVGRQVRILRRGVLVWPAGTTEVGRPTEVAEPDPELIELARSAAATVALEVAGVDILVPSTGSPAIIDINAFPSAARVPDAASWVAEHLRRRAAELARG